MKFLILIAHVALSTTWDSLLLVSSPKTPPLLKSLFHESISVDISEISHFLRNSSQFQPSLILDLSLDLASFAVLDSLSSIYEIPYLTITKTSSSDESEWRFYVFPPKKDEADSLTILIKYFFFDSFSVFLSNSEQNLEIFEIIKKNLPGYKIKNFIYGQDTSEENLNSLIKKFVKTTGEKNLLVLDEGPSLEKFIKYLKISKINQFGSFFLFGPKSIYSVDLEGSVILSNQADEFPDSIEKFYFNAIENILKNLGFFSIQNLKNACQGSVCFDKYFVVNQQNNKKVCVGKVKEIIEIDVEMVFPGNNPFLQPIISKKIIPIMIANGTSEPAGVIGNPLFSNFYYGAIFAMQELNKNFENFEYQLIPTDCGNISFNITWSIACFSNYLSNLGIAYITNFLVQSAYSNIVSLKLMHLFIPQISPYAISDLINNKTEYPEFLKFSGKFDEYIQNSVFLFRFYNWKDIMYIASDDNIGRIIHDQINEVITRMGLKIINPEKFRFIPENYTRHEFEIYKNLFESIKNSKCRILMLAINNPTMILEGLYDVGLRRGDLIIITSLQEYLNVNQQVEENYMKKRLEIFDGALLTSTIEYEGKLGKKIEKEMLKKYDSIENMCLTYDCFNTVHNAVKYLMNKGENYDDSILLIEAMRNQRFVGCSGDVFFIPNENSRSNPWLSILQVSINSSSSKIKVNQITAFNIFAVIAAKEINEPKWATGEKTTPTNYREDNQCVHSKNKQKSKGGLILLHIVSSFYLITVGVAAFFSKKIYNRSLCELSEKNIESYQDFLFRFFFACEFFQILSLEPEGGLIEKSLKGLNYKAGLDFITMFDLEFSNYWNFYLFIIGFSLTYVIGACISVILKEKNRFFMKFLEFLLELVLPIIGHFLFMPISLMLMSIFKCEESTSDDFSDSFFFRDCSQYCYQGKHKTFMILSSTTIAFFVSISTFFRPYWEITQTSLKIKTKVSYLSIMSVFQFSLILLKLNTESYSKAASGFLICAVILLMVLITWRMKPYNYEKMTAYQVVVLVMSFWGILISSISNLVSNDYELQILLFLGMFFILLSGLKFASTFVSKFEEDDENSVVIFLKFQFSRKLPEIITKSKYIDRIKNQSKESTHF